MDEMSGDSIEKDLESEEEPIPKAQMAVILGLEDIIAELKSINQKLDFNNQNISNFRAEIDGLRDEQSEAFEDISYILHDKKGLKNNTISNYLNQIRMILFWALLGLPAFLVVILVITS